MRRLIGICAGVAALLAGCSGGGSEPGGRSSPDATALLTSASAEPTYPNARPGEKPPVRPADALSNAGAEAFAKYFMQTVDWAYASMDSTLMRTAFDPATCNYCNTAADRTDRDKAAGKRYEGGRSTILDVASANGADVRDNLVLVVFDATPLRVYDSQANLIEDNDAERMLQFNVRVHFRDGAWVVVEVKRIVSGS